MWPVYLLLPRDVFACFDQGHDGVGEDGYPRDSTEVTSEPYTELYKRGGVHVIGLGGETLSACCPPV
jgi:hypothetical protein